MERELHSEAREIMNEMKSLGIPPNSELTIEQSRELLEELVSDRGEFVDIQTVRDISVPGPETSIPIRLYRPASEKPLPVLVFYHGGGWVRGSLDTHDPICRRLAKNGKMIVVSVDYRQPPEHQFPAAIEDSYAIAEWSKRNAEAIKGDPGQLIVGGDSAGGNLAAAVSLLSRERDGIDIASQMLLYPGMSNLYSREPDSVAENEGYFGDKEGLKWYLEHYFRSDIDAYNPFAFPLQAESLAGLPPALVVTCEFDMVRDDGLEYVDRLRAEDISVEHLHFDDMFHPFLNFPDLSSVQEALEMIADTLRTELINNSRTTD